MIGPVKKAGSRGIALLLTLGILLLLTLLALSFSSSQLTENEAAQNFHYAARAEEMALGGLETAVAVLRKDAARDRRYQGNPPGERPNSDDLFERWAIYYTGDNGFACKDTAKEDEAADLSDYDEFLYRVDERGRLDLTGMKDPWKDPPELDSRWIEVVAEDPVTGDKSASRTKTPRSTSIPPEIPTRLPPAPSGFIARIWVSPRRKLTSARS
jgi:hypothetical protein